MFDDRKDAGRKLAIALKKYKDESVIVLAIPRGGAEVGFQVAKYLDKAEFSIIIARKLPFPDNPESGFGAIAEDGSTFIIDYYKRLLPEEVVDRIIQEQKREIKRRIEVLRGGEALPQIRGKTVILVDDGIAMGSTMNASIKLCKNKEAKKIIVAVPVAGRGPIEEIKHMVDEIVVLEVPRYFQAVAQAYKNWYDVPDEEVQFLIRSQRRRKH